MRDHLLGYPSNAARAAECAEDGIDFEMWDYNDYPYGLGVPKRVEKEWAAACEDPRLDPELVKFETKVHALPDGSRINKHGQDVSVKRITNRGLNALLKDTLEARADSLKGISCKPAPVVGAITAAEAAEQMNAYMRGYNQGRREDSKAQQLSNAAKAAAFNAEQAARIKRNEEARYQEATLDRSQALNRGGLALMGGVGLVMPQEQAKSFYGYEVVPCGVLGG